MACQPLAQTAADATFQILPVPPVPPRPDLLNQTSQSMCDTTRRPAAPGGESRSPAQACRSVRTPWHRGTTISHL
eukprot:2836089-Prymnesium_polylepis.2